jgi:hypothetical protein
MKKVLLIIYLLGLCGIIKSQDIPKQINYQGIIKNTSGQNVSDGNYQLTFRIYNEPTGGTPLWSEIQTMAVSNGIFSALLGSVTPLAVSFDQIRFLGITVNTEAELVPRTLLTPSPYSFMALDINNNSVSTEKIRDGAVTSEKLQDAAVTTVKLQDGAVTALKIGTNHVVKSLNGLKDNVNLVAGTNITLVPSGSNITINATSGGTGTIGGSGTVNFLPLFTATTTLGNSILIQNGSNIGIGTTTPQAKLDVRGDIQTGLNGLGGNLILSSINNTTEGGQINWRGAGSYDSWTQDLYLNSMRFFTNSANINTFEIGNSGTGKVNLLIKGEINTTQTGDANLVPIAYGNINSGGTVNVAATTSNVALSSHTAGSGNYYFTIAGESISYLTYTCVATIVSYPGEITWSSAGGLLYIGTFNSAGAPADKPFTFVLYKK